MRNDLCTPPRRSTFDLASDLDSFFFGKPFDRSNGGGWAPAVDVRETTDAFLLAFDLPGVPTESVEVNLDGDQLVVKGERPAPVLAEGEKALVNERRHGRFERAFHLKAAVDRDGATAETQDGVLTIRLPKAQEAKVKSLPITKK